MYFTLYPRVFSLYTSNNLNIFEYVDIVKGTDSNVDGMFAIDGREDWSEMDLNALTKRIRVNISLRKNSFVCESVRSIGTLLDC